MPTATEYSGGPPSGGPNIPPARPRRRRLGRAGIGAFLLAGLAIILAACGGSSDVVGNTPTATESPSAGGAGDKIESISAGIQVDMPDEKDLAPNFSIILYQGEEELGAKELDLAQLRGNPIVLNFWAGLCPPCRAEMPDLQVFHDAFKDRATLIGIDVGQFTGLGKQQDAKDLLQELGVTYPAGFTNDSSVIRDYKVLGMPTTVFIRSDGTIFKKWSGALNAETLEEQTTAMLEE